MTDRKLCPYCAEEVRAEAIKCKHCGSFLRVRTSASEWFRSANDRMVAGVCSGLAIQFGLPTAIVRLAFVLMSLSGAGIGIVIYAVLWVVMPLDDWANDVEVELARRERFHDPP